MASHGTTPIIFDPQTAAVLSQVLPILLISLMVEFRRVGLHRRGAHRGRRIALLAAFFILFGIAESFLVLVIDGRLFPLRPGDVLSAVLIFGLLALLFALSLARSRSSRDEERDGQGAGEPD